MTISVRGGNEILAKFQRIVDEAPVATAFGAYDGMQDMMVTAKDNAPKDTGALAGSGYVTAPEVKSNGLVTAEAGFGGPSQDYVVRQHEDMTLQHPNGGEAQFLTRALDEHRSAMTDAVAKAVSAFLKTGRVQPVSKRVPTTPNEGPE